jgi:hypothetical protein
VLLMAAWLLARPSAGLFSLPLQLLHPFR